MTRSVKGSTLPIPTCKPNNLTEKRMFPRLRSILLLPTAAFVASLAFAYDNPPACTYGPGQCKPGFVWRDANDHDHVCVSGPSRDRAKQDNADGPGRKRPNSDGCKSVWVWRKATKDDHVCVTTPVQRETKAESKVAATLIDSKCTVGAVCKFNCDAEQQTCTDVNDGRDCKKVRAQCMRECTTALNATTPH
jgi:hypothetical protein